MQENLRIELARARRLVENPRRHYWAKLDRRGKATKKHEKLQRKADALSKKLFELTGEEA